MTTGEYLKKLRMVNDMTQVELADAVGVHRTTITLIETGRIMPSVDTARRLANVLNVNWTSFFES